jgi:hypothetical protein
MLRHRGAQYVSDENEDDEEGTVVYSRSSSSAGLRSRFMVTKICEPKAITTTPGLFGAGETETESEDQPVCAHPASTSQCQSFATAAAAPNGPHHPYLWATGSPDHTATTSYTVPIRLFTLAVNRPSLPWDTVQYFLCCIFSTTASWPSNRLYRFNPMGESSTGSGIPIPLLTPSTGDPDGSPVLGANYWPPAKMACLLLSTPHPDPALGFTGNMLARYPSHFDGS